MFNNYNLHTLRKRCHRKKSSEREKESIREKKKQPVPHTYIIIMYTKRRKTKNHVIIFTSSFQATVALPPPLIPLWQKSRVDVKSKRMHGTMERKNLSIMILATTVYAPKNVQKNSRVTFFLLIHSFFFYTRRGSKERIKSQTQSMNHPKQEEKT